MLFLQEALLKSNEVFETFKQDIEKVYFHLFVKLLFPISQCSVLCSSKLDVVMHAQLDYCFNRLVVFKFHREVINILVKNDK